jgi:Co/Zn/Cd efflux system component
VRGDGCCDTKSAEIADLARQAERRRILYIVLAINVAMFVVEAGAAWRAQSTALLADSVDMLGDAAVYGMSIFVVSRSLRWRSAAATAKGVMILAFGIAVLWSAGRSVMGEAEPVGLTMSAFGSLALAANVACLFLLWRFRGDDVNMASTFECSRNDVTANVGVIVAGGMVVLTGSAWPDVVAGLLIAGVFLRSAATTIRSALPGLRGGNGECGCEPGCLCCAAA